MKWLLIWRLRWRIADLEVASEWHQYQCAMHAEQAGLAHLQLIKARANLALLDDAGRALRLVMSRRPKSYS